MKKAIYVAALMLALTLTTLSRARVEETWTGEITDSACKLEHVPVAEGEGVLPAPECVKVCIRGGSKYMLAVDEKIYDIENQKHPDLEKFAGKPVKVTGELKGTAITVSKIEASDHNS
jgi:hypothetical protein